jgi:hypothetical protein
MNVVNETPFEVAVPRIDLGARGLTAVVIVKATFDLDAWGRLRPFDAPTPLVRQYLETTFGVLHSEYYFKKQGVDLCVLGTLRRASPVDQARVRMSLGTRSWELLVHGDRHWMRSPDASSTELVPSPPEPFTHMPLGYTRAFGGTVDVGGMPLGYPPNPSGRGYYRSAEEALGQPLLNIENISAPEQDVWRADDERPVAGWAPYPNFWALRAAEGVQLNPETHRIENISPLIFNHAHPDLVLEAVSDDQMIVIEGLSEETIYCPVPIPPACIDVAIGAERFQLDAPIDGLFLWADDRKLVVTQRGLFNYARRAEELRSIVVRTASGVPPEDRRKIL